MALRSKSLVTGVIKPSSLKAEDEFKVFGKRIKVPKSLKDKQVATIPWTEQGVLYNSFPINREGR
jgi:hypothetical protein